ncbi:PREDICTED: uncharacterized protein LOC104825319 [Tarenaya hassleriana]|uniref:uncharacterized protein LOC104825319 n=1 Tax=Tarenaya hassleriana TaxID=28532 RepID=UPI00053CA8B8|nr:PREDICTED: uncharacterized protein LOC104825319 [Tarenaya hassleriana]XP_010555948.1 PREDICTED: uncharacterized protein LOC104825319 [Tarenaya hassleriana]
MACVDSYDDEEWELCNDDGFVYKRRKRRRVAGDENAARPPDPVVDAEAEERNRRERMRRILLKLKSRYQSEIEQWEILSSSLSAMQVKADRFRTQQREHLGNAETTAYFQESSSGGAREEASGRPSVLDELLFMAEAQEAMIRDVSRMCEAAEEMCRVEEEEAKEALFDLQIWGSPRDLMSSLCADE